VPANQLLLVPLAPTNMLALMCAPLGLEPCRVALECSFGGAMNPRERKSLAHQIVRCYGHNRKAKRPLDLHLSGMAEAAQHPDVLPANGHWQAWTDITLVHPSAEERWPGEVVWLTPDASEPLLELDPSAVYVVGGLIDRSVASQATLRRAEAHRVSARRLPLREFAPRGDVHPILSPLSVVQILGAVHSGESWPDAIALGLPERYVKRREGEEARRLQSGGAEAGAEGTEAVEAEAEAEAEGERPAGGRAARRRERREVAREGGAGTNHGAELS
jgi:tRNA (guanine9-N1)-methyltransferase